MKQLFRYEIWDYSNEIPEMNIRNFKSCFVYLISDVFLIIAPVMSNVFIPFPVQIFDGRNRKDKGTFIF